MTETAFPVDSFKEAAPHLRRPFAPNAVRWKCQTANLVVPFVDARTVIARLNLVVPQLWETRFEPWGDRVDTNLLVCHLTIDGLTRSDIGKGPKNEAQKGAFSDALKRAAVHFGVNHASYAMKRVYMTVGDGTLDSHGNPTLEKQGSSTVIGPQAEEWLRHNYAKWLETERGRHFGPPLEHGDEPDAIGDEADLAPAPQQDDLELAAKREQAEELYAKAAAMPAFKKAFPKGKFSAQLKSASSFDDVAALSEKVVETLKRVRREAAK